MTQKAAEDLTLQGAGERYGRGGSSVGATDEGRRAEERDEAAEPGREGAAGEASMGGAGRGEGEGEKAEGGDGGRAGEEEGGQYRRKRVAFIYGNYKHYYGYRVGAAFEEDPRVRWMRREWFDGRDCVDVGCNSGFVSIGLVRQFNVKSMLGIDIDQDLIKEARRQWGSVVRAEKEKEREDREKGGGKERDESEKQQLESRDRPRGEKRERPDDGGAVGDQADGAKRGSASTCCDVAAARDNGGAMPLGMPVEMPTGMAMGMAATAGRAVEQAVAAAAQAAGVADGAVDGAAEGVRRRAGGRPRVAFRCVNAAEEALPAASADTVLCLSVTKWVHLNWGDAGLIAFFANIFQTLRPGGVLILEPQPWSSYKKKQGLTQESKEHYSRIKIFPSHFRELLLDKIGFQRVEELTTAVSATRGFDRPLFAYYK
ncbi:unnamed protein product [Closterium sp. Naga37s-1]|nr:unnamed protein product [Closterium sp. Naga37s-1]